MAWVRKAESGGNSPDENSQPFGNGGIYGNGSSLSALAATAQPFVRSNSYNSSKGNGSGAPNYAAAKVYESNGTVYFANPTGENRERSTVTSSGQHVIILGKAVNAERHCEFDS
jgi:hypothetical protein